jgi:hypothetical protein
LSAMALGFFSLEKQGEKTWCNTLILLKTWLY